MRGMRALRNFKTDRCYHLITRSANRAFYLTDEERTRFVERLWRVAKFSGSSRRTEATGGAARGTGHVCLTPSPPSSLSLLSSLRPSRTSRGTLPLQALAESLRDLMFIATPISRIHASSAASPSP